MAKLKDVSQQIFEHEGKKHNYDWYRFIATTPLSTQEISVYVDFQNNEITGDRIAYGSWDDIEAAECIEFLQTLQPDQINRDFTELIKLQNERGNV